MSTKTRQQTITKRCTTNTPKLSDASLARLRAAAHRYVVAGGSIFPNVNDDDRDDHLDNVVREVARRDALQTFNSTLNADVTDHDAHERVYDAMMSLLLDRTEAVFLFGALVGLETAALTPSVGWATRPSGPTPSGRKGVTR